jgi:hypothetical protein
VLVKIQNEGTRRERSPVRLNHSSELCARLRCLFIFNKSIPQLKPNLVGLVDLTWNRCHS